MTHYLRNLFVLLLMGLLLQACDNVDPNSPPGKRQAAFKEILHVSEDLVGMSRGRIDYNPEIFATKSLQLQKLSRVPWQYFPKVAKETEKTNAKNTVWKEQKRFNELTKSFESSTDILVQMTTSPAFKKKKAMNQVANIEKQCDACHKEFRDY